MKISIGILTTLAALAIAEPASAGDHVWYGGGGNSFWSNPANWQNNDPPVVGEAAPVGVYVRQANAVSTFDLDGLALDVLEFDVNGHTVTSSGTKLTLRGYLGIDGVGDCTNVLNSTIEIVLQGTNFVALPIYSQLTIAGKLSGAGGMRLEGVYGWFGIGGGGTMILSGSTPNTCSGLIKVDPDVSLVLHKVGGMAIAGDLENRGFVRVLQDNQFSSTSHVTAGGVIDLNNHSTSVGQLTLWGQINTGSGTLTLNGDMDGGFGALITGNLDLGISNAGRAGTRKINVQSSYEPENITISAVISGGTGTTLQKEGPGVLWLTGANTYSGTTVVSEGTLGVANNNALGSTSKGTSVIDAGVLLLSDGTTLPEPLTLNSYGTNGYGALSVTNGTASITGPVSLTGNSSVWVDNAGLLDISGAISGTGGLTKNGIGELDLTGASDNSFTGGLFVNVGLLGLVKQPYTIAVPGPLIIGDGLQYGLDEVDCFLEGQFAPNAAVTINSSGLLQLYADNTVGALTLNQGQVDSSSVTLTLNGDLTALPANAPAVIHGRLSLGSADRTFNIGLGPNTPSLQIPAIISGAFQVGFTKTGSGLLELSGNNTYSGYTTIENGTLKAKHSKALGSSWMGTIVNSNGALALENNITVIGEVLTLSGGGFTTLQGTNLWDGPITINTNAHFNVVNAGTVLNVAGAISGAGSLYKDGTGKLGFVANLPNTYAGATIVTGGTLELSRTNVIAVPGPMIIGDILSPQKSHVVRLLTPDQIVDNAPVTINSSGWLDLNTPYGASDTVGSLAGSGFVSLGYNTLRAGGNNSDTTFAGIITGWGAPLSSFIKQGGGTMNLNGNSPNFLGSTVISGGILSINGSQPSSPVYVNQSGTLAGNGVTGLISSSKGKVTPGNSPGSLKTGAFTLDASSTLELELNGTSPGVTYDQVSVIGAVNLGGAILHPMLGFNSASTNKFVIIANDGNDPVVGTFHGLPEGATLTVGSAQFQITYQGGDGNDVVLNQLSAITPPSFTGLTKQGNGHMQLDGAGIAGFSYTVQASTNLATSNWVNIGSTLAGLNGVLNYIDTNAPNFSMRFYRLVVP